MELAKRARKVGEVVKHRVPEDEIEAVVGERQGLGVGPGGPDGQTEALGVGVQRADHAGRDVGAGRLADDPAAQQVEAEVPRAGTDL